MFHHHITNLLFVFLLASGAMTATWLGRFFTERMKPMLRVKPFNCRPCLTFHFTWQLMGGIALGFAKLTGAVTSGNVVFVVLCIVMAAFLNYFVAKDDIKIIG